MPRKPRNSPNPPGRPRRVKCRRCDQPPPAGSSLSARGLCNGCSESALIQTHLELRARRGPRYEKWRASMLSFAARLEAEIRVSEQDRDSLPTLERR